MDFRWAVTSAAALASKDEKIAILQHRHDVPAGVAYRGHGFWAHFAMPEHQFPASFVLDAKQAAQAARKAKAETWDLVCMHGIPTQFVFKGQGPTQTISATPCTDPETWFPVWPHPQNELKDQVFRSLTTEWSCLLSTIQKAQDDKIRAGFRCLRFTPWGIEAGDEAQQARAQLHGTPMELWADSPLLEAVALQKLPALKSLDHAAIGFSAMHGYVQADDERRVVRRVAAWFPPLDKLLPADLAGIPEIALPAAPILKFIRSLKKKDDRRVLEISTGPSCSALRFFAPKSGSDPVEFPIPSLGTTAGGAVDFVSAGWPCLQVAVDGNRFLELMRAWPAQDLRIGWLPGLGSRTLLRFTTTGYVEHLWPIVPIKDLMPA
jgi:hypothetical protein